MAKAKAKAKKPAARKTSRVKLDKFEKYCQLRAAGESPSGAYRVVYAQVGTKPSTIWEAASRKEATCKVAARIKVLREIAQSKIEDQFMLDIERWAAGVLKMATYDSRRLYDPVTERLLPPDQLPDDLAVLVESIEYDMDGILRKYGMPKRSVAVEMLGKYLGAYLPRPKTNSQDSWAQLARHIAANGKLRPVPDVEFKDRVIVDGTRPPPGALVPVERAEG